MTRLPRPTSFVAVAAVFAVGLPVAVVLASAPPATRQQASVGPVTRSALGVTVSRPFGETALNDETGFDGAPAFRRVNVPHGAAGDSTLGPDGAIWFVDQQGFIVRFDPAMRKTERFDTGGASGTIATGADGRIYVAVSQRASSYVTVLSPEGKKIRDVDVPFAVIALEPTASGVWFASSDLGYPQRQMVVGRINTNGDVKLSPVEGIDEVNGPVIGKLRPEALARLSDGRVGAAGISTFRLRATTDRTLDPLFANAVGNDRLGPISSALGGASGELFVSRSTQGQDHSVIWRSAGDSAAPYVTVPDEPIRQQLEPDSEAPLRAGIVGPMAFGPDGKLWFATWRQLSQDVRAGGFLGRVEDSTHLTEWRMPYPKGEVDSAVATAALTVGIDGRIWFTDSDRSQLVGFRLPGLKGWRSLRPTIVSARREKDRAAVRIRCVGAPGKLCFGQVSLTRAGRSTGQALPYAVRAHAKAAGPEIVRYLKLPAGPRRGLAVRLSNGPRAALH